MARGGRRQYTRDSRGRFSSTGSTRQGRPPAQRVKRGANRLTRDNAGRITSVGGEGATARGGRLRTAGGKLRAKVVGKTAKRAAGPGMIRKTDVLRARVENAVSKHVERRQKAGLNKGARNWDGKPAPIENSQKRLERAQKRISQQKRRPAAEGGRGGGEKSPAQKAYSKVDLGYKAFTRRYLRSSAKAMEDRRRQDQYYNRPKPNDNYAAYGRRLENTLKTQKRARKFYNKLQQGEGGALGAAAQFSKRRVYNRPKRRRKPA